MKNLFESITEFEGHHDTIRRRSYGVIETRQGQFVSIQFRPWPKLASIAESIWSGGWGRRRDTPDRCLLYYNQPFFHRNYLILNYVVTQWKTTMATLIAALTALDQVAKIKRSDAILCDVTNRKISDRFLRRYGWEPQTVRSRRRHWIKRFYGDYSHVASATRSNIVRPHPNKTTGSH